MKNLLKIRTRLKNYRRLLSELTRTYTVVGNNIDAFMDHNAKSITTKVIRSVSVSDHHRYKILDMMGNPYGYTNPRTIHSPFWLVHERVNQSKNQADSGGEMAKAWNKKMSYVRPNLVARKSRALFKYKLGFDPSSNARGYLHALWTTEGTSKMSPRPVLGNITMKHQNEFFSSGDRMLTRGVMAKIGGRGGLTTFTSSTLGRFSVQVSGEAGA